MTPLPPDYHSVEERRTSEREANLEAARILASLLAAIVFAAVSGVCHRDSVWACLRSGWAAPTTITSTVSTAPITTTPTVLTAPTVAQTTLAQPEPEVMITSVSTDAGPGTVLGRASNLPADEVLWLFSRDIDESKWHPHDRPCPVRPDGTWECAGVAIGATGRAAEFELVVVRANQTVQQQIRAYLATTRAKHRLGMDDLPDGAIAYQ